MEDKELEGTIVDLAQKGMVQKAIEVAERMGVRNTAELITEGLMNLPKIPRDFANLPVVKKEMVA